MPIQIAFTHTSTLFINLSNHWKSRPKYYLSRLIRIVIQYNFVLCHFPPCQESISFYWICICRCSARTYEINFQMYCCLKSDQSYRTFGLLTFALPICEHVWVCVCFVFFFSTGYANITQHFLYTLCVFHLTVFILCFSFKYHFTWVKKRRTPKKVLKNWATKSAETMEWCKRAFAFKTKIE